MGSAFCEQCGTALGPEAKFCSNCGRHVPAGFPPRAAAPPPTSPAPPVPTSTQRGRNTGILLVGAIVVVALILAFVLSREDEVPDNVLTAEGLGPLRIGMSFDDAVETGWVDEDRDDTFGSACYYAGLTSRAGRDGDFDEDQVSTIFLDDELSVISTYQFEDVDDDEQLVASSGIQLGDDEDVVRDAFEDVDSRTDDYGTAHLQVLDEDADRGLDFSLDDSEEVVGMQAGTEDGLELLEGCA